MIRRASVLRVLLLLLAAGVAAAQGVLEITMRVVDDVRDLNAVVIEIGPDAIETRAQ
jgi:hypothetical protein